MHFKMHSSAVCGDSQLSSPTLSTWETEVGWPGLQSKPAPLSITDQPGLQTKKKKMFLKIVIESWAWWCTPLIPALGKQR